MGERLPSRGQENRGRRRVVVTGVGAVTSLGNDVATTWEGIKAGRSGIGPLTRLGMEGCPVAVAGQVKCFDPAGVADRKERRHLDDCTIFALAAATEAVRDAGWSPGVPPPDRTAVVVGSGYGGLGTFERAHEMLRLRGPHRLGPHVIVAGMPNAAAAQVAQRFKLGGPNQAVATACAAGTHSLGSAFRMVASGEAEAALAGGTEALIFAGAVAAFAAMGALSKGTGPEASRPFDAERDGFVISEGAGILALEPLDAALARGARAYGEILGFGSSADAHHICAPAPDGSGPARAMRAALADAEIPSWEVGYVNAHGTSTRHNDVIETRAIRAVFGEHATRLAVSSSKSMLGHMIGASGAVESIITLLTLSSDLLPPTINYRVPDPECDLDYVPNRARAQQAEVAIKNSFGFGGANACLVFGRC